MQQANILNMITNKYEPQQKHRLGTVIKITGGVGGGGLNRFYGIPTSPSASVMAQSSVTSFVCKICTAYLWWLRPGVLWACAHCLLYFVHFSFSPIKFSITFSAPMTASLQMRVATYNVRKTTKMPRFILPSFSIFPFFPLSFQCNTCGKLCQRFLSRRIIIRWILKVGTNVEYDKLYCVTENQPPPAYHSL